MVKISRYILVLTAIVGFSMVLPQLYRMAFSKPYRMPFIMYSCTENEFMIRRSNKGVTWENEKGNSYSRAEFEKRLPLMYVRQLMVANNMPDTIGGIEMNLFDISHHSSSIILTQAKLNAPKPGLYPLFESESDRINLQMPNDFFRITWRMEFIDASTNQISEEKSRMFSAALYNRGFQFPAKSISGIPNVRKAYDEGYLVIDSGNQLFHVKMIQGAPYVEKIELPNELIFKHIECVDFRDRKFYAYLFSTDNEMYILTQDEYELIKFPVPNIDPTKNEIRIYGDIFHYNIIIYGSNLIKAYVLDSDYNFVDEYEEPTPTNEQTREEKIFRALFPGQIEITSPNSNFIKFFVKINRPFHWLVLNFILTALQFFIVKQKKSVLKNNVIDFAIIALFGIFGFLPVHIFPNKFFD